MQDPEFELHNDWEFTQQWSNIVMNEIFVLLQLCKQDRSNIQLLSTDSNTIEVISLVLDRMHHFVLANDNYIKFSPDEDKQPNLVNFLRFWGFTIICRSEIVSIFLRTTDQSWNFTTPFFEPESYTGGTPHIVFDTKETLIDILLAFAEYWNII